MRQSQIRGQERGRRLQTESSKPEDAGEEVLEMLPTPKERVPRIMRTPGAFSSGTTERRRRLEARMAVRMPVWAVTAMRMTRAEMVRVTKESSWVSECLPQSRHWLSGDISV